MNIHPLAISGAFLVEQDPHIDERGSFSRQFCKHELAASRIDFDIKQCNLSHNFKAGTLRGMHYQQEPFPEIKLVSCIAGACYDVIVDLRKDSPTYLKWIAHELHAGDGKSIYIPAGVAHGFQTIRDDTTIYYQLGEFFQQNYYSGVRWNDPAFGIAWPTCDHRTMNTRDANYPDWII